MYIVVKLHARVVVKVHAHVVVKLYTYVVVKHVVVKLISQVCKPHNSVFVNGCFSFPFPASA